MGLIDVSKQLVRLYRLHLSCEDTIKQFLISADTVDAVEVVRCKDCKHRDADECPHGILYHPHDEGFCWCGERREDG